MKQLLFLLSVTATLFAADSPALTRARQELERLRSLVETGLLAPAKLVEARIAVDDAADEAVIDRTLYGHIQLEDLNERQTAEMVEAAQRRLDRQLQQSAHARQLIAEFGAAPGDYADIESEVARRRQVLDQAKARAELLLNIVETARAEAWAAEDGRDNALPGVWKARERVDGDHLLEPKDVKTLTLAFEKQFDKPMPVSARGSTAVHRALGFDHTGRIDVAVNPDAPEGVWLRKYLDAKAIPYYAFRIAIAGKATGAHIHIGPGSTRIHISD
jgi:hypothetical protein